MIIINRTRIIEFLACCQLDVDICSIKMPGFVHGGHCWLHQCGNMADDTGMLIFVCKRAYWREFRHGIMHRWQGITRAWQGPVTDAVACTIRRAGVSVHLRPHNMLRSHLVHPKDKVPKELKTGVVYQIQCSDCDATYVGETKCSVKKQVSEHHRSSSPVSHHLTYRKHSFSDKDATVLHQEASWFR